MTATIRRAPTAAAHAPDWRNSSACQGVDLDTLYSERTSEQARIQGICRGCPVRSTCLSDALGYEDRTYKVWGVAGGLTDWQRKALHVDGVLGNRPHLGQARKLASPVFAGFMHEWRDWPAETVAVELRKLGVLASPVTVRVALWSWRAAEEAKAA